MSFSDTINDLFVSQINEWDLARNNYCQLDDVRTRKISFGESDLIVQFNPGRITSSAAKVDSKSIESRPCFLCAKNRPEQQRGLPFEDDFTVLVNPFPIFKRHLTIVSDRHTDQRIMGNFDSMLRLAGALPDYVIFYNGPQCGASAPDHLHFQAGNKGFLPIESDLIKRKAGTLQNSANDYCVWIWKDYERGIISIRGNDRGKILRQFNTVYRIFEALQQDRPEPMLNILVSYSGDFWTVHIIPRKTHRPTQFFAEGDEKILLSPASVDIGGVVITPREEDFKKITKEDITDIFRQVCFNSEELTILIGNKI